MLAALGVTAFPTKPVARHTDVAPNAPLGNVSTAMQETHINAASLAASEHGTARPLTFMPSISFNMMAEPTNGVASGAAGEFNILTPNAMLGYGYDSSHFWYGVTKFKPSAIIVDSGSTDGGPYKLGMGKMTCGRGSYVRDLEPILAASFLHKIKVIISSVGGDGSNKHVQEMLSIVSEIAQRQGYAFKVATINTALDREFIKSRIVDGRVGPCGPVEPLTAETVDGAVDIVAQMGAEP